MKANKTKTSLILVCGLAWSALPAAFANDLDDMFKLTDANDDGRISRAEHAAGAQTMFSQLDTNRDGVVTVTEMDAVQGVKKASRLKFWDRKDDLSSAEKIRAVDLDADGQVSRAEHENASETVFARMDADNDGFLSKAECERGHKLLEKSGR